ncbi:TPA: ImmA/IrrE family metallo-endopeptidase [Streptococcus equi subsp. zooepidemicus]|nr:ImmA/IrrE family metallo-endopeptidase [Streptococcus equi subsp. zooepidemicus]
MTIEELVESYGVSLAYFDNDLWPRLGIYIEDINVIFVNKSLSEKVQKRVILHELGHFNKNIGDYKILHEKHELEADRYMIGHLVAEALDQLEDKREFNYLQFMQYHQLTTTAHEVIVIDEYYKLI